MSFKEKNVAVVFSGLLTLCVYELLKEAVESAQEDQICLILQKVRKQLSVFDGGRAGG